MCSKEKIVCVGGIDLMNNEKFIMKWEKNRLKGKFKYVMTAGIISIIAGFVGLFIATLVKKGDFFLSITEFYSYFYITVVLGLFIGGGSASLVKWSRNEEEYNNLIEKQQQQ